MSWTEVSTPDGPMRIYEAETTGEPRTAVIVVQEAFGVNDHIQDVAGRFAAEGWRVVAPELFHRAGHGSVADYHDFAKIMPLYEGMSVDGTLADIDATLGLLHDEGFEDGAIAIVGFCWGGWVSFLVAARRALGAAVGFYGGGIATQGFFPAFPPLVGEAATLKTPWLGLFGDQDGSIPVADVETIRTALESAPVDTEVIRYADAGHGFHCDHRSDDYRPEAAKDGWSRTLAWFASHVGKG